MTYKFKCPNCNSTLSIQSEWAGKMVCCANCKHQLQLPGEDVLAGNSTSESTQASYPAPGIAPAATANKPAAGNTSESPVNTMAATPVQQGFYKVDAPLPTDTEPAVPAGIFTALKKYARFSGRASRREYWLFVLLEMILCGIALGIVFWQPGISFILFCMIFLFLLIPKLAVGIRRCHDLDMSGAFIVINIVPCLGPLIFKIFCCMPSKKYTNSYGTNPNGSYPDKAWPAVLIFFLNMILGIGTLFIPVDISNLECSELQKSCSVVIFDYPHMHDGHMPSASTVNPAIRSIFEGGSHYHNNFYIGEGLRLVRDNPELPVLICREAHEGKLVVTNLNAEVKKYSTQNREFATCLEAVQFLLDTYFQDTDPYTRKLLLDNAAEYDHTLPAGSVKGDDCK